MTIGLMGAKQDDKEVTKTLFQFQVVTLKMKTIARSNQAKTAMMGYSFLSSEGIILGDDDDQQKTGNRNSSKMQQKMAFWKAPANDDTRMFSVSEWLTMDSSSARHL